MAETAKIVIEEKSRNFFDEIASLPGGENIKKCFACGTCAAGCPVTNIDEQYNSRKIIRQIMFGMREEVLKSPLIWFCALCYRCSARCPQEVNFSDVMRAIRYLAIKEGHAPAGLVAKNEEIDRFTSLLRRDMIMNTVEGRYEILEEIKKKIGKQDGK
jgi:heterodisulfide reductase subunit C